LSASTRPRRSRSACGRGLLPHLDQLGADGVKVALGALGSGAQLLEHLGAGFQHGTQLVPLTGRVGPQLLEFGGVRAGRLG
jgi:hypothetical protein